MNLDGVKVRPAMADDAYSVQVLRKHAWQARYVSPGTGVTKELLETELAVLPPSKSDIDHYHKMLRKPENESCNLVAVLNNRIIGVVFYDQLANGTGDIGVFIADEYNNKGVGAKLLENLKSITNNLLQVEIYARNPSREFYKAHGFVELGAETNYYFSDNVYLPVQTLVLNR